jgi:hypothetical protein
MGERATQPVSHRRRQLVMSVAALAMLTSSPTAQAAPDDPACPGIRPGAVMWPEFNQQYRTSWNFMLSGSDGGTYTFIEGKTLQTAGNADVELNIESPHLERTWARGKGPGVADGSRKVVGRAVWYARDGSDEWALIRLDRGKQWHSAVCSYGQPTSIDTTVDAAPVVVSIYGQQADRATKAHTDVLHHGRYNGEAVPKSIPTSSGDWSAPVLSGDNQAFGFLANDCCLSGRTADPALYTGSGGVVYRLQPLMTRAGKTLRIALSLAKPASGLAK